MDGFCTNDDSKATQSEQLEGRIYLRTKDGELKKHLMVLIGNELYFFKSRKDTKHRLMHCLTGTYLMESESLFSG